MVGPRLGLEPHCGGAVFNFAGEAAQLVIAGRQTQPDHADGSAAAEGAEITEPDRERLDGERAKDGGQ